VGRIRRHQLDRHVGCDGYVGFDCNVGRFGTPGEIRRDKLQLSACTQIQEFEVADVH
jgi:hypothetical protein